MFLLTLFGIGMFAAGGLMAINPMGFSRGIALFSEKSWFHVFEILSRFAIGVVFLTVADTTSYPQFLKILGGLLCFVSFFLIVIGSRRHKQFAFFVSKLGKKFRFLGLVALLCGAGLIYFSLV